LSYKAYKPWLRGTAKDQGQLIVSVFLRHIDPLCLMLSSGQKELLLERERDRERENLFAK